MDTLTLTGIKAETLIGVYAQERQAVQPIVIDLELGLLASTACRSDDIADAVDYHALTNALCDNVRQQQFQLIERLAQHIADFILTHYPVAHVVVSVEKPHVLPNVGRIRSGVARSTKERLANDIRASEFAQTDGD